MNIELTDCVVKVAFEKVAIDAEFMVDVEHLCLFLRDSALCKSVHSFHAMRVECAPHFDRIRKFVVEAEVACKLMIEFNRVVSALDCLEVSWRSKVLMCRLILFVNFVRGRENFGRFDKNRDHRSCVTKILCFCRLPRRCFFY